MMISRFLLPWVQNQVKDKKIQKLTDFETKKSVHINLTKKTHSGFRKALFDHGLSMQEVFERFAHLVASEDARTEDIITEAKIMKRNKTLERLSQNEVDNLYDAISHVDPFSSET